MLHTVQVFYPPINHRLEISSTISFTKPPSMKELLLKIRADINCKSSLVDPKLYQYNPNTSAIQLIDIKTKKPIIDDEMLRQSSKTNTKNNLFDSTLKVNVCFLKKMQLPSKESQ